MINLDKRKTGFWLGPVLFLITILWIHPEGMTEQGRYVMAITFLMASWWVTEAIPIPITSLLPLVLFPLMGVANIEMAAGVYTSPILFLFIGGFVLALGMEKWNLHKRIALYIIGAIGTNSRRIVLGFMVATGFLSMWISNTATTMMMVPIAMAIIFQFRQMGDWVDKQQLDTCLMLGIAYSASIGGMATLVGTPTNLIFSGFVLEAYGIEIGFGQWMAYGLPVSTILLLGTWWHMVYRSFPLSSVPQEGGKSEIIRQLRELGKIGWEEKWVLGVFGTVALAWISRSYVLQPLIPGIHDSMIALAGAAVLFMIPAKSSPGMLMDWETARRLPWGILLLFGGAFALALGFETSGLAEWMANMMAKMAGIPLLVMVLVITLFVNFLTEVTQNMATCTLMMPVLAAMALAIEIHPFGLMVPVCVAASCAFMLPFATAPNAIVFGTGAINMRDMIRAGVWLNLISVLVITLISYLILGKIWGFDPASFPASFLSK